MYSLYARNLQLRGQALLDFGRQDEARTSFKKAIEYFKIHNSIYPEDSDSWYCRGLACFQLKAYIDAIECFNETLRIDSMHESASLYKGLAFSKLGNYEEAVNFFEEEIEEKPESALKWYCEKGFALQKLRMYEKAREAFEKVVEVFEQDLENSPEEAALWNYKGLALRELKKLEKSLKAFDNALIISPECSDAWNNKGLSFRDLKKYDEAIKAFENALIVDKECLPAWHN